MRTSRTPRSLSSFVALTAALHLALVPAIASAVGVAPGSATPVQREQAQSKFMKGKDLFGQKKYPQALAEFQASHEIVASPNARLFIARTLREMGKLVEAYVEFGRTEIEAKELAPQDSRYQKTAESALTERKEIEPKLAFVTVTIKGAADTTSLKIAGEEVKRAGWNEPAPIVPGSAEVVIETPGKPTVRRMVTLAAGEKTAVDVDATTGEAKGGTPVGPEVPTPVKAPEAPVTPDTGDHDYRTYAYVAGGIGAAGLITFGVFGALAANRYSSIKDECGGKPCPESKRSDVEGGKTQQTIANIGLVIGIIGVGTGVTLFLLSKPKKPSEGVTQAVIGPSFVGLSGTF